MSVRLWNAAPIRWKSLNVSSSLNEELTTVALDSLDAYSNLGQTSTAESSPSRRRNRRIRTRPTSTNRPIQSSSDKQAQHRFYQNDSGLTLNDYFFEHQRLHGYTKGTPILNQSQALSTLQELLVTQVEIYLTSLQNASARSAMSLLQQSVLSIDVWAAIQRGEGSYHKAHVHDGALVSGVYYSSVPAGSAPLVFHKYQPQEDLTSGSIVSYQSYKYDAATTMVEGAFQESNDEETVLFQPGEGKVILFPPWLWHGVPPPEATKKEKNMEDSDSLPRVSFAFNLTGAFPGDPWHVAR